MIPVDINHLQTDFIKKKMVKDFIKKKNINDLIDLFYSLYHFKEMHNL